MKTYLILLLCIAKLISADVNLTSIPFVIPGADFVGYGFDVRYLETEHALRLPLVNWRYEEGRTYAYPLNRDDVYLVPDELFVRTVSKTEARSYIFSTVDEVQQVESQSTGASVQFTGETDSWNSLPQENRTDWEAKLKVQFNLTNGINIIPHTVQFQNKAFTLGTEAKFIKNSLSTYENYFIKNSQVNQLYQLFLDKRPLRASLEEDMHRLLGETWVTNQEVFEAFFEKYGTHVVVSAMMGGAITLNSVVEKTALTQVTTVVSNFSINENLTSETTDNTTQKEEIIRNSPLCNGTKTGYAYNTFTKLCELPPEAICYEPMEYQEDFTSYSDAVNPLGPVGPAGAVVPAAYQSCEWFYVCEARWGRYWWDWWNWYSICWWQPHCVTVTPPPLPLPSCYTNASTSGTGYPCQGTNCKILSIDTRGLSYDKELLGQTKTFSDPRPSPTHINFRVAAIDTSGARRSSFLVFIDTRDMSKDTDDIEMFTFFMTNNKMGFRTNSAFGMNGVSYTANGNFIDIRLVIDYSAGKVDLWYLHQTGNDWRLGIKGQAFTNSQAARIGKYHFYATDRGIVSQITSIRFCNAAGGVPYTPMTTHAAVSTTTAKFKQVVSGKVDTSYTNSYNKFTIRQSNNWKLKGGKSEMVDLLNFGNPVDVFEEWKVTINDNPAPVVYTLKEISSFFPDIESAGASFRDIIKFAIRQFLTERKELDPIISVPL